MLKQQLFRDACQTLRVVDPGLRGWCALTSILSSRSAGLSEGRGDAGTYEARSLSVGLGYWSWLFLIMQITLDI